MGKIEKLKLNNFKSFKSATIPFFSGYTTVVGANASGKSNICDAICFAIGASSMKKLRAGTLEDLVSNFSRDGTAHVELHLRDSGGEKHVISRTIDKKGTSVFRLNGRRTTKFYLDELLASMNIYADGHNIIMQGDVTRFIKMTPRQRREIIDEISGIAEYESKKNESFKELEKVEGKIREASIVIGEKKGYLRVLEKEKIEAEVYLDLKKKQNNFRATITKKELETVENSLEKCLRYLAELKENMDEYEKEKSDIGKKLKALEKESSSLSKKIFEESDRKQTGVRLEIEEVKTNTAKLEEKLENFGRSVEKERIRKEDLNKKISEIGNDIKRKENELDEISSLDDDLRKRLNKAEEEFKKLGGVDKDLERIYKELDVLTSEIDEKKEKLYELQGDVKGISETLNLKKGILEQTSARMKKQVERKKELEKKLESLDEAEKIVLRIENSLENIPLDADKKSKIKTDISDVKKLLSGFKSEILELWETPDDKLLKKLQREVSGLEMVMLDKNQVADKLRDKISKMMEKRLKIRDKFEESGIPESKVLKELQERVQTLRDQLSDVKVQSKTIQSEIEQVLVRSRKDFRKEIKNIEKEIKEIEEDKEKVLNERNNFLRVLKDKEMKARELATSMTDMYEKKNELDKERSELAERVGEISADADSVQLEVNENEVQKARLEDRHKELSKEFSKFKDFEFLNMTKKDLYQKIEETERQLDTIGKINMKAIEMYEKYSKEIKEIGQKKKRLEDERESIMNMMHEIEDKKYNAFIDTFRALDKNFNVYFKELYPEAGSMASLKLENPDDALNSGLLLEARPMGKRLKSIDSMSGGEKTLSALAFMFAIQAYNPSPFYILDEVDAALDRENSERIAKMIKKFSKGLQFVLVTHNPPVIRSSDQIIGVHMGKDGSSFVELDMKDYA